jgi:5-oxoprolinase (ATP-hydrolysing)
MSGVRWQIFIDRGGTFTDCLAQHPETGELRVAKLLSHDRAPLDGIRQLLRLDPHAPIPPCDVRMGTTVATNALLERKGVPCALVTTRGFGDLLAIGTQARPHLFELAIRKHEPLPSSVVEVDARCDAAGRVLARPDAASLRAELGALCVRSVAIAVMHAYRNPELELELGRACRSAGFEHVCLSHEVTSQLGLLARADTTVLDAYLTPLLRDYVAGLLAELHGSTLRIMQSSGGLTDALRFRGPHAILSGPAGGVIAVAKVARLAGCARVIGFDMGGTSTDVSRYESELERVYEAEVAGVRVRAPMMLIHTVAAGGGSLCRYDGHRLSVGPESAGANPGPLCYGRAEATEPTLTDVNLVLGRLQPDRFVFALDRERARRALEELAERLRSCGDTRSAEQVAQGLFEIANSNMAEAVRRISVARGYDVREHALVVFGGAGGQHACALARRLGIGTIVLHPLAGVMSAWGMGLADVSWHGQADAGRRPLDDATLSSLAADRIRLEAEGRRVLAEEGFLEPQLRVLCRVDLRYAGTETALTLALADAGRLRAGFDAHHERLFGYARAGHAVEVVALRIEVIGTTVGSHDEMSAEPPEPPASAPTPLRQTPVFLDGRCVEQVPVFSREALLPGHHLSGPAIVLETTGTLVVEAGFELAVQCEGLLILTDRAPVTSVSSVASAAPSQRPDPVLLEIMGNLYMSIAEQMGHVLERTALSTNIRERLDFSCAVFDAQAGLVANAPHIPVHLGAMGESVLATLRAHPDFLPGDVFATNDPAQGGSHLPDVTVVTPVHDARGRLVFFTASRGHHADIGGITPGSMPAFSRTLGEEGVVLRSLRVVRRGRFAREHVLRELSRGPFPARRPTENLADLEAQIAANHAGAMLLCELVERYGLETVHAYMQHVQDDAAAKVAEEIMRIPDGAHRFADQLDDGTPLVVTLYVDGGRMLVDFDGTGAELDGNLNAPRAVTTAAVLYFLRTLVGHPIPLNSGCLRPIELRVAAGSLLAPSPGRAVAGGNVETSQRIVDVLLGAAGRAAASQGTMNNLSFGDDSFGYYETIAGGAGAGPGFAGASAVQTHMTNTKITDPEVLEARFPVRLRQFSVRRGSGGAGRFRGGDGAVREFEFLRAVRVSILSERRTCPPFGLAGGLPGACGRNLIDGREIGGKASLDVAAGTVLRIETPGGGGWGRESG